MPTYEYVCQACGHRFERFQSMSDRPVRKCPACDARAVERVISAGGGLVFKGPGFYATDYRKPGPKERDGAAEAETGKERGSGSGTKGESEGKGVPGSESESSRKGKGGAGAPGSEG